MVIDKQSLSNGLFYLLLIVELIFLLTPAWSASPLWNIITFERYFPIIVNGSQIVFFIFSFMILCMQRKLDSSILLFLCLIEFCFLLSLTSTGFKSGLFALVAVPISFLFMFGSVKNLNINKTIIPIIVVVMWLWSVVPIVLLIVSPALRASFFVSLTGELLTFSGFAFNRNFYGMIIGVPIIVLLTYRLNFSLLFKCFMLLTSLIGVFLCASRTLLLVIVVCVTYDFFLRSKKVFFHRIAYFLLFLIGAAGTYTVYTNYSIRPEKTNDDRKELYEGFFEKIKESPLVGQGEKVLYYSSTNIEGSPAHNFILQLGADYGVPVLTLFLLFLAYVFIRAKRYLRIFLIYTVIWGLFQPYFSFSIPSSQVCMPLLIGWILDIGYTRLDSHNSKELTIKENKDLCVS